MVKDGHSFWLQPWVTIEQAKRAVIFGAKDDKDFNKTTESDCGWVDYYLNLTEKDFVLDVGCGVGRMMKPLSSKCNRLIGIDPNDKMISYGREYCPEENCFFRRFDGIRIPFPDEYFDKAFSFITMMHLEKHHAFVLMSEVFRVLKIGGKFVFNVPNLLVQGKQYLGYLKRYIDDRPVIVMMETYTPQEVRKKLEIIGFEDVLAEEVSTEVFGLGVKKQTQIFPGTDFRLLFL